MPAMLDDPTAPVKYRVSGNGSYASGPESGIPPSIFPRLVILRDRITVATLVPFFSPRQIPSRLLSYLCDQLNKEIEAGDTYPMVEPLSYETFRPYWFGNFAAVMLLGDINAVESVQLMEDDGCDWAKVCLGSFYVKPNYPGRSSHVCNGGFLVTPAARNKGVGKSMGECYLDWAPQLGYTYSIFNLVYETNTASIRIWDALGFKKIGRVPACGNLRSSSELVDAIIYGRDLSLGGEDFISEERFDKIRYYLKHDNYPAGADRAEKSRLRSAAINYKLIGGNNGEAEKLMFKGKEVIADPQSQYDIARDAHAQSHGGINKVTATIATVYHWVRIKETVSMVVKNCAECKESGKAQHLKSDANLPAPEQAKLTTSSLSSPQTLPSITLLSPEQRQTLPPPDRYINSNPPVITSTTFQPEKPGAFSVHQEASIHGSMPGITGYHDMAIDPQIMQQIHPQIEPPFQSQENAFDSTGMAHYSATPHISHHHHPQSPSAQYHGDENDDQLMAQATAAVSIDLVDGAQLDRATRLPQNLLHNGYVERDNPTNFER